MAGKCLICGLGSATLHSHHVVPQAYGGVGGPEVDLCGDCHTNVHAHAIAILSFKRNGKNKVKNFWRTAEEEDTARPLVAQIVNAALNYRGIKQFKMITTLDEVTYNNLRLLKNDLGKKSLEATLAYCIQYVYNKHHGNEQKKSTNIHGW